MGMKKKRRGKKSSEEDDRIEERFRAAETRPQFRPLKQETSKVVLDERFASVLTDSRFQLQGNDKYGRRKQKKDVKDELSAFYTLENKDEKKKSSVPTQENSSSSEDDGDSSTSESKKSDDENSEMENDGDDDPNSRIAYLTAFSRGELEVSSSSDEDDSSQSSDEGDEEGEDPVFGTAGVLDPSAKEENIEITSTPSPYLVVMNMDWDHIRAVDLFCILSSFTPPGAVKHVQVYLSDFGKERIAKENQYGPTGLWKQSKTPRVDPNSSGGANEQRTKIGSKEENDSEDDQESSESESTSSSSNAQNQIKIEPDDIAAESDFDPEKLRAYEASKLRYYFAVVEFASVDHADVAYREIDGLEFERSSAVVDLRSLAREDVDEVVMDRSLRDEATSVPSNYEPPDFVVSALQQSKVQCTWDMGDPDRERALTTYARGGWENMVENDDLKAYLAPEMSSDEEEEGDSSDDEKRGKGSRMRKLLGLDSDNEPSDASKNDESSSEDDDKEDEDEYDKQIKFIPGKASLEEKIRSNLQSKGEPTELTPWQKYQEKRKQKRRERKQAARQKRKEIELDGPKSHKKHGQESLEDVEDFGSSDDEFFLDDTERRTKGTKKHSKDTATKSRVDSEQTKHELELLLAGEDDEEHARDYDIRGIQRMEKNKGKKLRGSRKRKEEKLASAVSGTDFKVNVADKRFSAVLDGSDDRFGIDKTDPNFKDTSGMRDILAEQSQRRKKRKKNPAEKHVPNVSAESSGKSAGSTALSSLVQRLKKKVSKNVQ